MTDGGRNDMEKPKKLVNYCSYINKTTGKDSNAIAPKGWKFQDCTKISITIVRTKKVGDWFVDVDGDEIPKDMYIHAFNYEGNKWEIINFMLGQGHGGGVRTPSRHDALSEVICDARALNAGDEVSIDKKLDVYRESLRACRKQRNCTVE